MSSVYMARGRTAASAATIDHGVAALWNPHATARLTIHQIWICVTAAPGAGSGVALRRLSARGTAGSTVTPAAVNDIEGAIAPVSGALIDLATYSVQPTLVTGVLAAWTFGAVSGAGMIMDFPRGVEVPAGAGVGLVNAAAVAVPATDVTFVWTD